MAQADAAQAVGAEVDTGQVVVVGVDVVQAVGAGVDAGQVVVVGVTVVGEEEEEDGIDGILEVTNSWVKIDNK